MGKDSWKQQAGCLHGWGQERAELCFITFQCKVVAVTSIICARNGFSVLFPKNELLLAPLQAGRAALRIRLLVINPSTQRLVTTLRAAGY